MKMLISLSDFENRVIISQKLENDRINPSIIYAQEIMLPRAVCPELIQVINDQVTNCDIESRIQYLLNDFVKPYLVYAAYANYLVSHSAEGTSTGIKTISDVNDQEEDNKTIYAMIKEAKSMAQAYEERTVNFLNKSLDTYPEQKECQCKKVTNSFSITAVGKPSKENDLFY